jgi:CheY-like chemotaxis protein
MTLRRPGQEEAREIARGLALAVQAALEAGRAPGERSADPSARAVVWSAAVNVAELLDLAGLGALLLACERHLDAPPRMVSHALERLARLAHETHARGDIWAFTHADPQLAALAGAIGSQEWTEPGPAAEAPEAVQPLAELLQDFTLDDAAAIARAQVTLPVAAGLRAALDWLGADMGGALRVTLHESALSLAIRATHEPGLGPAGAVLALSGGALLPEPDGRWSLRVPVHTERPAFLLVRQGELSLALPWHAVARMRIADDMARAVMTEPSLRPWSPLARAAGERPAALLALGLTRAWLHLDHVVWRVFATPAPAEASDTVPGGRLVVRTDEGEEYWVVEVGEALRGVPPLHTPKPQPRVRPAFGPPGETQVAAASFAAPADPFAPPAVAGQTAPPNGSEEEEEPAEFASRPAATLRLLGPEHVHPLHTARDPKPEAGPMVTRSTLQESSPMTPLSPAPVANPVTPPTASPAHPPTAHATAAPGTRRHALLVDDSLVARLSLGRILEREGWSVEWVEHASEMWEALQAPGWGVVFVDVSLPDANGRDHLRAVVANRNALDHGFEIVALTRDAREERMAQECGIRTVLRKPFTQGTVEELVRRIRMPGSGGS